MEDLLALARRGAPTLANAIQTFDLQPRDVGLQPDPGAFPPSSAGWSGLPPVETIVARRAPEPDWLGAGNEAPYTHVRTVRAPRAVVVKDLDDPRARLAVGRGACDDLRRARAAWAA
jgi:hypothetical protein